jgi:MFS family permease
LIDRDAYTSLFFSRTIYAVNWYNIAALFAFIASDFSLNVSGLGVATAWFYVGVGLFLVPGGVIAAKYGARNTAVAGVLIASIAVTITAFTTEFYQLLLLRFIVGVGSAIFFAPGVTLIARTFRREYQGFGVGTFQSAYYVGGVLGLFAWSVLAEVVGWRFSLVTSGLLGILGGLLMFVKVPKDELRSGFVVKREDLRRVLSNRWLVLLSLELVGFGSGTFVISGFMVYYLEQSLHLSPGFAGTIGSLTPLCAMVASPLCGMLYAKTKNTRLLIFSLGVMLAFALALDVIASVPLAVASTILAGFGNGAFTVVYLAARDSMAASAEYESFAISWVTTIEMLTAFWSPIMFSLLVLSFGYGFSWLASGVYTLALISIILYPIHSKR